MTKQQAAHEAQAPVIVTRDGAVALITLNEPKSLNALSPTIKQALSEALPPLIEDPEVRALVITGAGRAFCAGGDIRSMVGITAQKGLARMSEVYKGIVLPLTQTGKPVIAAVNGLAVGAGFSLAMTADFIVAGEDAMFKAGFPGIGLVPDLALAYMLPRAVGLLRAKDILITNREVKGPEAQAMGLATRLAPPGKELEEAMALAHALANGPSLSFGLTKQLTSQAFNTGLADFLAQEGALQSLAYLSEDFAEGRTAFLDKRKPHFKGR
jgi:2-(1,2-epoxy-1,2-dihydrophenyl)acetyl-CoA isomerase